MYRLAELYAEWVQCKRSMSLESRIFGTPS